MQIHIDLSKNALKAIAALGANAEGLIDETLSRSAAKVRADMVDKSRHAGVSTMASRLNGTGRRVLTSTRDELTKRYNTRWSHQTNLPLDAEMGDLIKFRVYYDKHFVLVGWIDTKTYTQHKIRGGKIVGSYKVKGSKSKKLAERMFDGGRVYLTSRQKRFFRASGWTKAANKGYIDKRAHKYFSIPQYKQQMRALARREFDKSVAEFKQMYWR